MRCVAHGPAPASGNLGFRDCFLNHGCVRGPGSVSSAIRSKCGWSKGRAARLSANALPTRMIPCPNGSPAGRCLRRMRSPPARRIHRVDTALLGRKGASPRSDVDPGHHRFRLAAATGSDVLAPCAARYRRQVGNFLLGRAILALRNSLPYLMLENLIRAEIRRCGDLTNRLNSEKPRLRRALSSFLGYPKLGQTQELGSSRIVRVPEVWGWPLAPAGSGP